MIKKEPERRESTHAHEANQLRQARLDRAESMKTIMRGVSSAGKEPAHKEARKITLPERKDEGVFKTEVRRVEDIFEERFSSKAKKEFSFFFKSFKDLFSLRAFIVGCFDVMFYLLFVVSTFFIFSLISSAAQPLISMDPASFLGKTAEELAPYKAVASKVLLYLLIGVIFAAISFIISYSISRALMWTTLLKKKLTSKGFFKFLALNFIWLPLWVIIFYLLLQPIDSASQTGNTTFMMWYSIIVLGLFIIIISYLSYILYYVFTEKNEIFYSFKIAFLEAFKRIKLLWLPVLLIVIVFIILNLFSLLFNYFLIDLIRNTLIGLLMIAYFTWAKIYAVSSMQRHVRL